MSIRSYRDLVVWQESIEFVVACYKTTERFPAHERYCLTSQLRRATISVSSNIAEGQGRAHIREFMHHISIAYGSLMEVECHVQIALRLGYLSEVDASTLLDASANIGRMLNGLKAALERKLK